jgi:hypothetical protein
MEVLATARARKPPQDPTTEMAAMKIQNAFRKNKERKESKRANGSTTVISM